jgi:hypothetical protein
MKNQAPDSKADKPVRFTIPLDATAEQLQKFIDELKRASHAGEVPPDPRSKWYHKPKPTPPQPLQEDADKEEGADGNPV